MHWNNHKNLLRLFLICMAGLISTREFRGQALPAGIGPGTTIAVGGTLSGYKSDYGQRTLGGFSAYVDANLTWRYGLEAEGRWLNLHEDPDKAHFSTYLIGPRFTLRPRNFRPYVKVLGGYGEFTFPFNYAVGRYFVVAPGGGLDIRHNRINIRVVDFEYQTWPQFTYGTIHPYGISSGVSVRIF